MQQIAELETDSLPLAGPIVRFLLQHIALLPPPPEAIPASESSTPNLPLPITCKPCPPTLAGGYSSTLGILLCQNRFMSKGHMEDALSHELIHAWDGRRFEVKGEWGKDLRAHACTEVSTGRRSDLTIADSSSYHPRFEQRISVETVHGLASSLGEIGRGRNSNRSVVLFRPAALRSYHTLPSRPHPVLNRSKALD